MMDNKKTNIESTEVKGYRELDSYESYKANGNQGTRHLVEPNGFKKKVIAMINQSKKEDKYLYHALKIMFSIAHVKSHEDWLLRNIESSSNIYRTYNNVQKSVERNALEILYTKDKIKNLTLKVNKHESKDSRLWKLILELQYNELTIITDVSYNKMAKYIDLGDNLEETDFEGATTMLGIKHLNKQQYFNSPLKESFNILDNVGQELVRYRMKMEKEDE